MSFDLFNVLDLSPKDFFLFTHRDQISHPFVFDYLLQSYGRRGVRSVAVLLADQWSHYRSVAAKCVTNLTQLRDKGIVEVIDVFAEESNFEFKEFSDHLFERLSSLPTESVVLIDDITLLFSTLGVDSKSVYKLVHKLHVFCRQNSLILAIGANYPLEEDDEELNHLVTSFGHKSDILCQIDKTCSGFSPLVSGCLQIYRRLNNSKKQFNYKISDRSVKLLTFGSQLI